MCQISEENLFENIVKSNFQSAKDFLLNNANVPKYNLLLCQIFVHLGDLISLEEQINHLDPSSHEYTYFKAKLCAEKGEYSQSLEILTAINLIDLKDQIEILRAEARDVFKNVIIAEDLMRFQPKYEE